MSNPRYKKVGKLEWEFITTHTDAYIYYVFMKDAIAKSNPSAEVSIVKDTSYPESTRNFIRLKFKNVGEEVEFMLRKASGDV